LLCLRWYRLCHHHCDGCDLVRPHGGGDRPARLAAAASRRWLLPAAAVHDLVRQADSGHAALRPVPDPAVCGAGAAADCDDGCEEPADGQRGLTVAPRLTPAASAPAAWR